MARIIAAYCGKKEVGAMTMKRQCYLFLHRKKLQLHRHSKITLHGIMQCVIQKADDTVTYY